MIKKETLVLIPAWGMGHVIPMAELAKLFTTTTTTFSVSIVIFDPPYDVTTTIDPFISRVTSSHPSISFHRLPKPSPPPDHHFEVPTAYDLLRFTNPQLTHFLKPLQQTSNIRAVVLDMFCSASLDVARELDIPAYFFCPYSAFAHATFASLPSIESQMASSMSFRDLGRTPLHPLPCLPPIPASYLPEILLDRGTVIKTAFMYHLERHAKADGILINTFEALEARAVKAINDGMCGSMPPIYCIGPLESEEEEEEEKHECLKWLDEQPKGSVVFLCFGSMGSFPVDQVKEIANGLERSGQRFLWVLKNAFVGTSTGEKRVAVGKSSDPDLDQLLPEGFLDRTEGRGMVVKLWAPQKAVLRHEAVGAFVSHCGWNSTLEAVNAGVAIIAWPLYAEQRMNKLFLVEEAKVAVEMEGSDGEEMVTAGEVEKKVRWLMETEEGKEVKERMRVMKESAVGAWMKGGPSDSAWMEFVARLKSV